MLEWYQEHRWDSVVTGLFGSLFIAGFLTLKDWGIDWASSWSLWLFVLAPLVIFYLRGQGDGFAAGADWFATSKKRYVKLYELTEVTVTNPPGLQAWGLELRDQHGGFAGVSLREIQQHQALWDLVYNGIAHSVLRGSAQANDRAQEMLQLQS